MPLNFISPSPTSVVACSSSTGLMGISDRTNSTSSSPSLHLPSSPSQSMKTPSVQLLRPETLESFLAPLTPVIWCCQVFAGSTFKIYLRLDSFPSPALQSPWSEPPSSLPEWLPEPDSSILAALPSTLNTAARMTLLKLSQATWFLFYSGWKS